jgi:hypothetical protein
MARFFSGFSTALSRACSTPATSVRLSLETVTGCLICRLAHASPQALSTLCTKAASKDIRNGGGLVLLSRYEGVGRKRRTSWLSNHRDLKGPAWCTIIKVEGNSLCL